LHLPHRGRIFKYLNVQIFKAPALGAALPILRIRMSKTPVSPQTKTAPRGGFRVLDAPEALRPIRS